MILCHIFSIIVPASYDAESTPEQHVKTSSRTKWPTRKLSSPVPTARASGNGYKLKHKLKLRLVFLKARKLLVLS